MWGSVKDNFVKSPPDDDPELATQGLVGKAIRPPPALQAPDSLPPPGLLLSIGHTGAVHRSRPARRPQLTQAFYILFANQIESPTWPHKVCQNGGLGPQGAECVDGTNYRNGVFVTSPQNITPAHVAKVKRDVPGSKLVR